MPQPLAPYTQAFADKHESDVGQLVRNTVLELFEAMQGNAIDTAIAALQQVIARHYHGDQSVSTQDLLRAARELRAMMHEKAAMLRQCRAEAIEMLGLRPRQPLEAGAAEVPTAAVAKDIVEAQVKRAMTDADKLNARFVKTYGPAAATKPPAQPKNPQNDKSDKPQAA